jgi:type IV pilus assembly protein PilA
VNEWTRPGQVRSLAVDEQTTPHTAAKNLKERMMSRLARRHPDDEGFTLIELLVVMIIIGILAAIAIPVFLSQRSKARDTSAKADVSTIGKEIATYYVDKTGAAPGVTIVGGRYLLSGSDIGKSSLNITSVAVSGTSETVWCAQVNYTGGTKSSVAYSANAGLGGLASTCAAGVLVP